jgi:hypothetical protein
MAVRAVAVAVALTLAGYGVAGQTQTPSRADAASLERKLTTIVARGLTVSRGATPVRTSITERELNAYLKFSAKDQLPNGLVDPELTLVGDRRVIGSALVDLDAVRGSKRRGWFDPAAYMTGTLQVQATGTVRTADGVGRIDIESATVGGVPVPKSLLQEMVSYYSRSAELPGGFDLDEPFELPAAIREVEIQRGTATVIQ